jgi:hypothetical protein
MEPGVGGSSATPAQWDRGNRQVPPGKSHRAGRILTTGDVFGLGRRGRGTACHCRKPEGAHTAVDTCSTAAPGVLLGLGGCSV